MRLDSRCCLLLKIQRFTSIPMSRGGGGRGLGYPWRRPFCHRSTSSDGGQDQDQGRDFARVSPPFRSRPPPPYLFQQQHPPPSSSRFYQPTPCPPPPTRSYWRPPPPPACDGGPPPQQQQHVYQLPQVPSPRGVSRPVHGYHRPRPADYRNWVRSKSQPPPHWERFRLLSYNILADYLARDHRSKLYFHIPPCILDWEWRKRKILIEIGLWSPDIMCLQEVDRFQDLEKEMTIRGYCGIWKMRTGTATDGCATFWRANRFQLCHEEFIEFNKLGLRDNIAQICVLESRAQGHVERGSSFSGSPGQSRESNQVVVCNIHVLYNPRRGEIKFGQVRVLLDRAYSVSRLWNNAPVVICGDFNSVPKSPLYNFVAEQKVDLYGLARDQVSGQYSACIRAPRPYPDYGRHRVGPPQSSNDYKSGVIQDNDCAEMPSEKVGSPQRPITNLNSVEKPSSCGQRQKESSEPSNIIGREICQDVKLNVCGCVELSGEMKEGKTNSYNFMPSLEVNNEKVSSLLSQEVHIDSKVLNLEVDVITQNSSLETLPEISPECTDRSSKCHLDSSDCVKSALDQELDISISELVISNMDGKSFDGYCENSECHADTQSKVPDDNLQGNIDCCYRLDKSSSEEANRTKAENCYVELQADQPKAIYSNTKDFDPNIQLNSVDNESKIYSDSFQENPDPNFLAELHGLDDMTESTEGNEIFDSTTPYQTPFEQSSTEFQNKSIYDPSLWTPADIETASGNSECTFLQHNLKLKSVYTEVEDCAGTKDSSGEPEVTSYNRQFMGTVDYIWCSEGVQTVKVLDTIRKDVLQRTPGFPTPKWGSDHLAVACELAFVKA